MESLVLSLPITFLFLAADPSAGHGPGDLLNNIGLCVIVAAILAFIANKLKQPALLAYLLAGVLIGPEIGFRLITDHETIEVISEIGLVLLLFIIGLEMDLKKLRASRKPVIATGVTQFLFCVALGIPFFLLLGFRIGDVNAFGGEFGLFYMAVAAAISSTMIVVKVISTISDQILKGTDNERLLKKIRQLCPQAKAIVTADSPQKALELYNCGADFVFIPRMHSSAQVAQIIESGLREGLDNVRAEQIAHLKMRDEVLA